MDFFCLPILCGCSTKISGEGNDPRLCPRCNNVAVQPVKKREWFELFCVPVVPYNTDHIWHCGICQWQSPRNGQFQPMAPGGPPPGQYMQPGYGGPPQGYQGGPPQGYGGQVPMNYGGKPPGH